MIFLIALAFRYIGLKFSYPLFTHPDEGFIMNALPAMSTNHTLDPGTYVYPGYISFYSKFVVLNLLSLNKFGENFGWVYWKDPYFFYTVSRLMTAVQGALIPVVAWFIARRFKQINFSWAAALLFIFYPPFVLHSHYVTVDIPLTLFTMLVILASHTYLASRKTVWLILACLLVAVAGMEKYPGLLSYGIVLVTIGISAFTRDKQGQSPGWGFFLKTTAWSLVLTAFFIVIIAPSLFVNYDFAWNQIVNEARPTHLGSDGLGWGGNLWFYLKEFFTNAGLVISLFGIIGIVAAILLKDPSILLLFFGGGYWLALSILYLHWSRWSLPMMTTPLFLAAIGSAFIWQKARGKVFAKVGVLLVLAVGFVPFTLKGIVTSIMLTWADTRNLALSYMEENNITRENTISEGYTPFNPNNKNDIFQFDIFQPGEKQHLVLSSIMGDRYAAEPERYVTENAFYTNVRCELELVKKFQPNPEPSTFIDQVGVIVEYVERQIKNDNPIFLSGPTLEIFKLQD